MLIIKKPSYSFEFIKLLLPRAFITQSRDVFRKAAIQLRLCEPFASLREICIATVILILCF